MRSVRASHMARCSAIQCSAYESVFGLSSQIRTRPVLLERITPLCSSTERCFMKDGSAISKGAATVVANHLKLDGRGTLNTRPHLKRKSVALNRPTAQKGYLVPLPTRVGCWRSTNLAVSATDDRTMNTFLESLPAGGICARQRAPGRPIVHVLLARRTLHLIPAILFWTNDGGLPQQSKAAGESAKRGPAQAHRRLRAR